MINLKKLNRKSANPHPFQEDLPLHHTSTLIFVIKIYFPHFKRSVCVCMCVIGGGSSGVGGGWGGGGSPCYDLMIVYGSKVNLFILYFPLQDSWKVK